jgi:phospholipid transport system substrate-binding protein
VRGDKSKASITTRLPLFALVLVLGVRSAQATAPDPAAAQVQLLTNALLKSMQGGPAVPMTERYRDLQPTIGQVFALPLMTRLSVGPGWAGFSPQQQKAAIAAFSRYTIANYAHNFRTFSGQSFQVEDQAVRRGDEKIILTTLASPDDTPARLLYRMVQVNGLWKIVDVYYNGISQLTLHRVDFAGAVASGGPAALIAHLNKVSDDLMR